MNITETQKEVKNLPPLVKKSSTYKLFVPAKVEGKIRYLQNKFPSTERSGVLFISYKGNFEDNNLEITCQDIYPMDLGNSTFTSYNMNEDVAAYMAENIELFDCDCQLVHSHHGMQTFFSGTDLSTLRSEGNDKNCFVSLIVNNEGTYVAAITRKIQTKAEVTTKSLGTSYEFFGEGTVVTEEDSTPAITQVVDNEVIEYYMLDVEREIVENPYDSLDKRFNEIEENKKSKSLTSLLPHKQSTSTTSASYRLRDDVKNDYTFEDWKKYNKTEEPKVVQQNLFDDETMKEMETCIDWQISPKVIKKCVAQILTCSLLINPEKLDLNAWVKDKMKNLYDVIFEAPNSFTTWSEFITEFVLDNFIDESLPEDAYYDPDVLESFVAYEIYNELSQYESCNHYIKEYMEVLNRHIQ